MSAIGMHEFELEDEFEEMYEYEDEYEDESEAESEAFFGALASLGKRALQSPALRKAAISGAKAALGPIGDALGGLIGEDEFEDEFEYEFEYEGELEDEFEEEYEDEYEDEEESEYEAEINPIRRIYPQAMMEHLGHAAMEAESEDEAEAFARAMVPVAAHHIPHAAVALKKAAPHVLKSVAKVAKTLLKQKATRPLVRVLPAIVKSATKHIARQSHGGRVPISPKKAVRILAHHTAKTLGSPRRAVAAYQKSKALDKHIHHHGSPVRLIRGHVHYAKPLPGGGHGRMRKVGWPGRNHWYLRSQMPHLRRGVPGVAGVPGVRFRAGYRIPTGYRTPIGYAGPRTARVRAGVPGVGRPIGYRKRRRLGSGSGHSCGCCCCGRGR